MKGRIPKIAAIAVSFLVAGLVAHVQLGGKSSSRDKSSVATLGDVRNLKAAYNRWKAKATQNGGDRTLVLSLRYTKGLSA